MNFSTKGTAIGLLAVIATLSACDRPAKEAKHLSANPGYEVVTNIHETMAWILDPAADVIWDSAGFIITAEGEQDLSPTTDEGWDTVLHAAATLTEAGNLLMMPGRSAGDDWVEYSKGLTAAGIEAMAAAQAQDADALFDAGGRIFQVCKACHNQYWVKGAENEQE